MKLVSWIRVQTMRFRAVCQAKNSAGQCGSAQNAGQYALCFDVVLRV